MSFLNIEWKFIQLNLDSWFSLFSSSLKVWCYLNSGDVGLLPLNEWLTREVRIIVLLMMKMPRPDNWLSHITPLWFFMLSQGERTGHHVICAINCSVCFHCGLAAKPSLMIEIWQLWMSFVFPASVWDVSWRVEAYELWHADCNSDGKEEDSRERESQKIKTKN